MPTCQDGLEHGAYLMLPKLDRLHPVVYADCGYVLANELFLTVPAGHDAWQSLSALNRFEHPTALLLT
jgi:hypothetical protein